MIEWYLTRFKENIHSRDDEMVAHLGIKIAIDGLAVGDQALIREIGWRIGMRPGNSKGWVRGWVAGTGLDCRPL